MPRKCDRQIEKLLRSHPDDAGFFEANSILNDIEDLPQIFL